MIFLKFNHTLYINLRDSLNEADPFSNYFDGVGDFHNLLWQVDKTLRKAASALR